MKKSLSYVALGASLLVAGCGTAPEAVPATGSAADVVESYGYIILEDRGITHSLVLDKALFFKGIYANAMLRTWGLQRVAPDAYFGRTIDFHGFLVDGHPLEAQYGVDTIVTVMLSDGIPFGGLSSPAIVGLRGGSYSIDGKTIEQISGLSYEAFLDRWKQTYGEQE